MDLQLLIECWRCEVSNKKKPGSRIGLFSNILKRAYKHNVLRYLLQYRLAQFLYAKGGMRRRYALRMQRKLNRRYAVDISIAARIGPGFRIAHLPGVVITGYAQIGRNFFIRQNSTVGIKTLGRPHYSLVIGDDVSLGAHSCIIADELEIGSGVTIGAMSFVNKDIPAGCTFYNVRQNHLLHASS
ncbi:MULTISPECIES: serine acetyltransferase [Pseudomonas]|uniref:Serine acetyltransferase n=1 Tax=Pseudomonas nitroreducens TaxID=46680 RepID=A0A246FEG3_PSENT|nr:MULTISPECIES: serine acetyltransferase [Pseudomonas]MCG8909491.1 serine acetyltransferase [Pseudomonas sp. DP-17]MDU4249684.1 serine acetyltransferase [Pseudomonas sp.]OWP52714.1 serine acetyltransferase [Pseudomonas nitroreducens]